MIMICVCALFIAALWDEPVWKTCAELETINRLKLDGLVEENRIFDGTGPGVVSSSPMHWVLLRGYKERRRRRKRRKRKKNRKKEARNKEKKMTPW